MQTQFLDLYRASIRSASELMKTSLEQSERLQQQQLQLIRTAMEENTRSSSQVGEVKSLDDVLVLNSRLAGAQLERVAEFWSSWWRAAGDTQKSMIDQMQSQLGQAKDRMEDAARIAASQVPGVSSHERKERKSA
jgi:phasin protein